MVVRGFVMFKKRHRTKKVQCTKMRIILVRNFILIFIKVYL